jgi:hypothetical protein
MKDLLKVTKLELAFCLVFNSLLDVGESGCGLARDQQVDLSVNILQEGEKQGHLHWKSQFEWNLSVLLGRSNGLNNLGLFFFDLFWLFIFFAL